MLHAVDEKIIFVMHFISRIVRLAKILRKDSGIIMSTSSVGGRHSLRFQRLYLQLLMDIHMKASGFRFGFCIKSN